MDMRYGKLDAFTGENSAGNPAACVYLERDQTLSDEQMQQIAREHKGFVSEMAFCKPSDEAGVDYVLRYYSSECEVDFCGHATIACMVGLIRDNAALLERGELSVRTMKGILPVYNQMMTNGTVFITAPPAAPLAVGMSAGEIARALRIPEEEIALQYPIQAIDAGLSTLIVPIKTLKTEVVMHPDLTELAAFARGAGVDVILVFCMDTEDDRHLLHTRVFPPLFGYLEDPATGSANSAMGYYLLQQGLWDGREISVEQGNHPGRFNVVRLGTVETGGETRVRFGGTATLRIEGRYHL